MDKRRDPMYQAQDILSRRDHSEAEVRAKMKRKGFSAGDIDSAIAWLYDQRLLDDRQFAQRFVESTLAVKAVGPRYLSAKLKQRGVESSIITAAIADGYAERSEEEVVQEAIERWQRSHPRAASDRQRLTRFLLARGFSFESVRNVTTDAAF